jgi:hypothetical protein
MAGNKEVEGAAGRDDDESEQSGHEWVDGRREGELSARAGKKVCGEHENESKSGHGGVDRCSPKVNAWRRRKGFGKWPLPRLTPEVKMVSGKDVSGGQRAHRLRLEEGVCTDESDGVLAYGNF